MRNGICKVVAASVVLLFSSHPLFAWVAGKVVDEKGIGVFDATVSYQKLDNRLIYVYTDKNGDFAVPGPDEWNLKDLPMYKNPVPTINSLRKNCANIFSGMQLRGYGSSLVFTISGNNMVNVELYSMSGKMLRQVYNGLLSQGRYLMELFYPQHLTMARQIFLVKVRVGEETQYIRMINLGNNQANALLSTERVVSEPMAKTQKIAVDPIDTLRVGKSNYSATKKAIVSYTQDVGVITIVTRDIENEVSAVVSSKSLDWKAYQCVMGHNSGFDANYGSWWFGVGGFGGGENFVQRADEIDKYQKKSLAASGQPALVACDAVHGMNIPPYGTVMPHNLGMGCTHNGPLVELAERVCAIETRAGGVNWVFAPCFDVVRDERHGRTYEGWDEGPDGSAYYAPYAIRGFQTSDLSHPLAVAATMKHFAGAGGTMDGKHGTDANTGTYEALARIHLPSFRAAANVGVASCMAAFNSWLGVEMHLNAPLLTDTLKKAWAWDGFVCGDWNEAQALGVKACFNAGVDNPMVIDPPAAFNAIKGANSARVDDGCNRILRIKTRMNLVQAPFAKREYLPTLFSDKHKAVARECVRRSLVLLKNSNAALPINKEARVHVVGAWADDMGRQSGGWTNGWQGGSNQDSPPGTSILEGIREVCAKATFSASASNIPNDAEVIVVVVGEEPYAEALGDNANPTLSSEHQALISQCAAANKKVVGILITGRPLIITNDIKKCDAFVVAWLPGSQGGGVADVVFNVNKEDFTGTLSHTWPISVDQIPINTGNYGDRVGGGDRTPLFPYGYGIRLNGERIQ
jgi:beta-glucosidase